MKNILTRFTSFFLLFCLGLQAGTNVSVNTATSAYISPTATQLAAGNPLFVVTSGSYSNPAWVTALAASKLSGTVADANIASAATWNAKQSAITFGTGVQTALGVNVGSAGAPVLFGGAGGTPSSITLTNATGTAASLTAGMATVADNVIPGQSWANITDDSTGTTGPFGGRWIMFSWVSTDSPPKLRVYYGSDGKTWTPLAANPVYTAPAGQDVGPPSSMYYDGKFWCMFNGGTYGSGGKLLLISSPDLVNWTLVTTLTYTGLFSGQDYIWPGSPFLDTNGDVRMYFTARNNSTGEQQVWTTKASNRALSTWGTPAHVTGLTLGTDGARDPFVFKTGTTYRMIYTAPAHAGGYVSYQASSANAITGWVTGDDGLAGFEGPMAVSLPDGRWRVYAETSDASSDGMVYAESSAGLTGLLAALNSPTQLTPALARHHGSVLRLGVDDASRVYLRSAYDPQNVAITGGAISGVSLGLAVGLDQGLLGSYVPSTGDTFGFHLLTTATTGITGNSTSIITSSNNGIITLGKRTAINAVTPWLTLNAGGVAIFSSGTVQGGAGGNLTFGGAGGLNYFNGGITSSGGNFYVGRGQSEFYGFSANWFTGSADTSLSSPSAGIISFNTTAVDNGLASIVATNATLSGVMGVGGTPNANAALDVQSTTKAFMPPRMTTTQKNAIASPAAGMMVYDSTLGKLSVYTGAAWETVTSL